VKRSRIGWAVGALALVVLGVVGGPFVFIHLIEGKAAPPLTLTTTPSSEAASSGSSSSLDGTWTVASGSQAGYRVKEVLFGQTNVAVGRTSSITGSLTVSGDTLTAGTFSADLTTVSSDKSQRDHQFQSRIMNTATYPTATFKLTQPVALAPEPADGATVTRQVTGDLTLHGTTKSITFAAGIRKSGSTVAVSGSVPIVFADYNIPNPSYASVVTTESSGTLEFLLNFTKS
jgi:polyisoprenoid-binding protein YceI